MFRKQSSFLSYSNLSSLHVSALASKTSSIHPGTSPNLQQKQRQQCRPYAMISKGHNSHHHGKLRWPEMTSANSLPTPYQIFSQKKGSPYSKRRFYELVKLYHPDRHHDTSTHGLSYATKLERYRLVVAANNILSDPVKRSAYDCYGAGWNGAPDVPGPQDSSNGRGWGDGTGGPSQNATWEDWERWYQRDAKGPQEPRFVSNSAFVGLILIFALIGGIGQATRAGTNAMSFVEQRDTLHKNISKDLIRRREITSAYGSREERIDSFLRQRDPLGITGPRENIKQRPTEVYQEKDSPTRRGG